MINIAICDDEEVFSSEIEYMINKYYDSDITYKINIFNDPLKMLKFAQENIVDILFMDVEMPNLNGIELVKQIKELSDNCIVFFVTSHSTYITDIFRLGSFQFLQKPINENDFKYDFNRALSHYKKNHTILEIVTNGTIRNIFIGDILYIEVYKKEIRINLKNEVITHYGSLNQYENKLKGYSFSKPHKSFLVNLKYIAKFDSNNVYLFNSTQIPLTRVNKDNFLLDFNKFIRGKCL